MFLLCSPSVGQDGLHLFHQMQTALGGAEKIASVRDFEQIVRAETWDNEGKPHGTVRKRVRFIRPNYLRIDQVGPDDTYVLYFDGTSGWEILPDKTVADLAGGELRFARGYLTGLSLNFWLADRDAAYEFKSKEPNVISIATKDDPSNATDIALDPVTFLPVKQTSLSHADPDRPVPSEERFSQWETLGGVRFPNRITNFHSGKRLAEITVEWARLNGGIKPGDLAAKPADLRPVMSR
jgi:hypothetical protein